VRHLGNEQLEWLGASSRAGRQRPRSSSSETFRVVGLSAWGGGTEDAGEHSNTSALRLGDVFNGHMH